jgi:hypothetical protein
VANALRLRPDQYDVALRAKEVEVKEGVLKGAWMRVRPTSGEEDMRFISFDNSAEALTYAAATLIMDWNLTDQDGKPLPINEDTIGKLSSDVYQALQDVIGPFLSQETAGPLSGEPSPNSSEEAPPA